MAHLVGGLFQAAMESPPLVSWLPAGPELQHLDPRGKSVVGNRVLLGTGARHHQASPLCGLQLSLPMETPVWLFLSMETCGGPRSRSPFEVWVGPLSSKSMSSQKRTKMEEGRKRKEEAFFKTLFLQMLTQVKFRIVLQAEHRSLRFSSIWGCTFYLKIFPKVACILESVWVFAELFTLPLQCCEQVRSASHAW